MYIYFIVVGTKFKGKVLNVILNIIGILGFEITFVALMKEYTYFGNIGFGASIKMYKGYVIKFR